MKKNSLFDNWFVYNYQRLRNIFGRYLHEDAFHDAYLAMKREVVISEIPVESFEPYFFGVYKKCRLKCIHKDSCYCFPDNEHFFLLMQEEETPSVEVLAASDKLVYDILLFVKKKYPPNGLRAFQTERVRGEMFIQTPFRLCRHFRKCDTPENKRYNRHYPQSRRIFQKVRPRKHVICITRK